MDYSISLIAAVDRNGVIGSNGKMPWNLSEDLLYFKEMTHNCPIIMGRKTHQSIGRILSDRENIVITRQTDNGNVVLAEAYKVNSPIDAVVKAKMLINDNPKIRNEIFVIGGGEIYKQFLNIADRIYLTEIDTEFEGDTFFPEFSKIIYPFVIRLPQIIEDTTIRYRFNVYMKDLDDDFIESYTERYNLLKEKIFKI